MKNRWIVAGAAACAVALLTVPMLVSSAGSRVDEPVTSTGASCKADGTAKLDLTLNDMNGAAVRLADYKGKVIVLNFWATWCPPCQGEIPELVNSFAEYKDSGLVILGISIDDTPEMLRAYAAQKRINYPMLLMQDDVDEAYGPIGGVPISFFIGRDGSICTRHFGPLTKPQLEREIKALL